MQYPYPPPPRFDYKSKYRLMKYFLFFIICSIVFFACERETALPVESTESVFIPFGLPKSGEADYSGLISSPEFRAGLEELGLSDASSELDFSVGATTGGVIIQQVEPDGSTNPDDDVQARVIRWIIDDDPNLPRGMYLLDTCTGGLLNMLGRPVGTLAGVWGQDYDC